MRRDDVVFGHTVFVASASSGSVFAGGHQVALTLSFLDDSVAMGIAVDSLLFAADFEEGDFSEWSSVVP